MEYENTNPLDQNILLRDALQRMADAPLKTIANKTQQQAILLTGTFTLSAIAAEIDLKDEFSLSTVGFRPLKTLPILDADERIIRLGKTIDMHVLDLRPLRPSEKMNLISSASYTAIRSGFITGIAGTFGVKSGLKLLEGGLEITPEFGFAVGFTALAAAVAGTAGYKLARQDLPAIYKTSKVSTIGLGIPLQTTDSISQDMLINNLTMAKPVIC